MRAQIEAILVDTREKDPFEFEGTNLEVVRQKLDVGDYAIKDVNAAVERKSVADFVGTMAVEKNRRRFVAEFNRAYKSNISLFVVVEGPWFAVHAKCIALSGMNPRRMMDSSMAISARFKVPFMFATGRKEAEEMTLSILRGCILKEDVR